MADTPKRRRIINIYVCKNTKYRAKRLESVIQSKTEHHLRICFQCDACKSIWHACTSCQKRWNSLNLSKADEHFATEHTDEKVEVNKDTTTSSIQNYV